LGELLSPKVTQCQAFEAPECGGELSEKQRKQLRGLGLFGEGEPCDWPGIACRDCKVISIHSSEATGHLKHLEDLRDVEFLDLSGSQVQGTVADLLQLTDLNSLYLYQTQLSGNVAELSKLISLESLHLSDTRVSGDVAELSNLTRLKVLRLYRTQVSGNVSELSKLKSLRILYLYQNELSGNVEDLSKLKGLQYLDLSETQVSGNVAELKTSTRLHKLSLAHTQVHGDVGFIAQIPDLVEARFSNAVSGKLEDLEGCCRHLRELHLGVPALILCSKSARVSCTPAANSLNRLNHFCSEETQVRTSEECQAEIHE